MSSSQLRVAICGAGIAGATLASLLARGGHQVVVVERDQGVRSSGSPVDVRGAAYGVVDDLGLVARLREVATDVRELVIVDSAGQRVASMATRRSQDREFEVPRADLSAVLLGAAREDADLHFDDTITGIEADEHGVDVTSLRGALGRFDLVVGADGLHSATRRLVFGPEGDYVTRLGMYVATTPIADRLDRRDTVLMYNEPGKAIALHPAAGHPGAAFMFRSARDLDPRDAEGGKELLTTIYGNAGWRSRELLDVYLSGSDTYFDAVSRVRVATWFRGRTVLLGDAASGVSLFGEGSSAAIAGAATLARSLSQSPQDVPAALTRYQAQHRPVTERGQRAAPIASRLLVPASRAGITVRNRVLRLAGHRSPARRRGRRRGEDARREAGKAGP